MPILEISYEGTVLLSTPVNLMSNEEINTYVDFFAYDLGVSHDKIKVEKRRIKNVNNRTVCKN